jgi:chromosome segregation ATPase
MIRTLVEIQGGRVSIRETAAETTVTITVDGAQSEVEGLGSRLYTAEEVGDLQASEAELVAAPLRLRIQQLARETTSLEVDVDSLRRQLAEQRERAEKAERDRDTFKAQAYEQNDRAAEKSAGWEASAVALSEVTRERDRLAAQIGKIREAVWVGHLDHAMENRGDRYVVENYMDDLTSAVAFVRSATGQP